MQYEPPRPPEAIRLTGPPCRTCGHAPAKHQPSCIMDDASCGCRQYEPPAPALGAIYDVLTRCVGTYQSCALTPKDAAEIIRHIDAQAARDTAVLVADAAALYQRAMAGPDRYAEQLARSHWWAVTRRWAASRPRLLVAQSLVEVPDAQ